MRRAGTLTGLALGVLLLIPAAGVILYSGNDGRKRRRDRDG